MSFNKKKIQDILIILSGIIIFFIFGFIFSFIINIRESDKVIKIVEKELNILDEDRDLIQYPGISNSNLIFDAYFFENFSIEDIKKNNEVKNKYYLKLLRNKSKRKNALVFEFDFPIDEVTKGSNWTLLLWTNLGQLNKPEGYIKLRNYDEIQIPLEFKLDNTDYNVDMRLGLNVLSKPKLLTETITEYQFINDKKILVNQNKIENNVFKLKNFSLDKYYQPHIILSRMNKKNIIKINNRYKGYLNNFFISFLFNGAIGDENEYLSGEIILKNPVIYKRPFYFMFDLRNYIFGIIFILIFIIIWLNFRYIQWLNIKKMKLEVMKNNNLKKEIEIKELGTNLFNKIQKEKKIVKGVKGYYHWELNKEKKSNFLGIIREEFLLNDFIESSFFNLYKKDIMKNTIILIIDYDNKICENINHILYYYNKNKITKFPGIKVSKNSQWFFLMAFLIQIKNGIFKLNKLDYKNIIFNKYLTTNDEIYCLRIPRNNNDIGIDNEKYNELIKRYELENIIKVSRKEKIKEITYSLNRDINYTLFIHSQFIKKSAFEIKDNSIFSIL